MISNQVELEGMLAPRLIKGAGITNRETMLWRLRRWGHWNWWKGWLQFHLALLVGRLGIVTVRSELRVTVRRADGTILDYGVAGYRVVTDAGVGFLVDDWDNDATDITTMNFHASGTGATAENVTDTALVAEATTVTDRVAGTKSQPAANQLRSVGTQNFTGAATIAEHGLFSVITEAAGVLWDRTVLGATVGVGNGDAIEWTYTCTVSAGS